MDKIRNIMDKIGDSEKAGFSRKEAKKPKEDETPESVAVVAVVMSEIVASAVVSPESYITSPAVKSDIKFGKYSRKTILLSPAAASFDQFNNFENRGNYFKKLIIKKFKKRSNA